MSGARSDPLIGLSVLKEFNGFGFFSGSVLGLTMSTLGLPMYTIR